MNDKNIKNNTNEFQTLNFENHNVRTVFKDDQLWQVLKDVCEVLQTANHRNVSSGLSERKKVACLLDTFGGPQRLTIINEAGLYKVVFRSDKPEAQKFADWFFYEVLPSIRRFGFYADKPTAEINLNEHKARVNAEQELSHWKKCYAELLEQNATLLHALMQLRPKMRDESITIPCFFNSQPMSGLTL